MASLNLSKEKLQFVKGAFLKKSFLDPENPKIIIQHYETDIFIMDENSKTAYVKKDCSLTSNRMIERAIFFYEPKQVITEQVEKWSYSGGFVN